MTNLAKTVESFSKFITSLSEVLLIIKKSVRIKKITVYDTALDKKKIQLYILSYFALKSYFRQFLRCRTKLFSNKIKNL